jgi:hypothetical protein
MEKDRRGRLRNRLRHHLHPLHLYCRLCSRYGEKFARPICVWYEYRIWGWLKRIIEELPDDERG